MVFAVGHGGDFHRHPAPRSIAVGILLTQAVEGHALLSRLHGRQDEKRAPILREASQYDRWLSADPRDAREFATPWPTERLAAHAAPTSVSPQLGLF